MKPLLQALPMRIQAQSKTACLMVNSERMGAQVIPIQRKTMPLQALVVQSQTVTITTPNQESAMQYTRMNYTRTETNPQ